MPVKKKTTRKDDKLKSMLSGKSPAAMSGPQEVSISNSISPIAKITVV